MVAIKLKIKGQVINNVADLRRKSTNVIMEKLKAIGIFVNRSLSDKLAIGVNVLVRRGKKITIIIEQKY